MFSVRDGKKLRKTFPTEAAARSWRADAQSLVNRGALRTPAPTTLREAAEALLKGMKDGSIRTRTGMPYKPSVIRTYEAGLKLRRGHGGRAVGADSPGESVLDLLGGRKLATVERRDVQELVDRLIGFGLDPSTIRNTIMPLRVIFRRAQKRGDVLVNPTFGLELPAPRSRRVRVAPPTEAARLIAVVPKNEQAIWAAAFYAGLRLGELLALRWEDVDFVCGVIHVERAYDPKARLAIDVKSTAGQRRVPIPATLRGFLLEHRLATGNRRAGLLFGHTPEQPFHYQSVRRHALAAWKRAELDPIGLHEARHTFASLMIAAGVNVKAISIYMGHASVKITLDRYGHLMPNSEEDAAARLDAYLKDEHERARKARV